LFNLVVVAIARKLFVDFKMHGKKTGVARALITVLTIVEECVSTLQDIILLVNNRLVWDMRGWFLALGMRWVGRDRMFVDEIERATLRIGINKGDRTASDVKC